MAVLVDHGMTTFLLPADLAPAAQVLLVLAFKVAWQLNRSKLATAELHNTVIQAPEAATM